MSGYFFDFSRKHLTIFVLERHRERFGNLTRGTNYYFFLLRGGFETTLLSGPTTVRSRVFLWMDTPIFFGFRCADRIVNGRYRSNRNFLSVARKHRRSSASKRFQNSDVNDRRLACGRSLVIRCRSRRDGRLASKSETQIVFFHDPWRGNHSGCLSTSVVRRERSLVFLNRRKRFTKDGADRYAAGWSSSLGRSQTTITWTDRPGRYGSGRQNVQRLNVVETGNVVSREQRRNVWQGERVRNAKVAGRF